jgi:hypothetical protein
MCEQAIIVSTSTRGWSNAAARALDLTPCPRGGIQMKTSLRCSISRAWLEIVYSRPCNPKGDTPVTRSGDTVCKPGD